MQSKITGMISILCMGIWITTLVHNKDRFWIEVEVLSCKISFFLLDKLKTMVRLCSPFETFIIILMVGAGSLITIVLKWSDQLPSINSIGENATFSHPFLQSTFMFLGELFCIAMFYLQRYWRNSHRSVELNNGKKFN